MKFFLKKFGNSIKKFPLLSYGMLGFIIDAILTFVFPDNLDLKAIIYSEYSPFSFLSNFTYPIALVMQGITDHYFCCSRIFDWAVYFFSVLAILFFVDVTLLRFIIFVYKFSVRKLAYTKT